MRSAWLRIENVFDKTPVGAGRRMEQQVSDLISREPPWRPAEHPFPLSKDRRPQDESDAWSGQARLRGDSSRGSRPLWRSVGD